MLASGNLPEFTRTIETDYVIVTSKNDVSLIEASPAYRALKKFLRPRIVAYPDKLFGHPIETHKKIWQNGYRAAMRNEAFYITNPADMIWSDGSFGTIARHMAEGKKSIYAMFARVVDDSFTEDADRYRGSDGAIEIPPRSMIDMTMRHLHPFHATYLRDSGQYPFHYEYVYWPIKGEGLLMRTFATTVLGFYPAIDSVTSNYTLAEVRDPQDIAFIDDSDDMCGVSLTPLMKDHNWYSTPRTFDIDELGAWWITFDGAAHVPLARTSFRFHTGGTASPEWRRAERMSDFVVLQGLLSREIIRLGRILKNNDCVIAAEILATALYAGRLRRRWRWRGPQDIFVPNDIALARHRKRLFERYLVPGKEADLVDYLAHHMIPTAAAKESEQPSVADQTLLAIEQANIIKKIDLPFGNRLFIVNKLVRPAN